MYTHVADLIEWGGWRLVENNIILCHPRTN